MAQPDSISKYNVNQLPFLKTYVVRGKISNPEYSVENVRTEIRYLEVGEGPILGSFYGGPDTWDKVVRALSHSDATFVGEWSPPKSSYSLTFKIENIIFGPITTGLQTDCICNFECLNMEIQEAHHDPHLGDDREQELEISYVIPYRSELFIPSLPDSLRSGFQETEECIELNSPIGKLTITTDEHLPKSISEGESFSISVREQRIALRLRGENPDWNELAKEADEL